jgi:hypothetical protein
MQIADDHAFDHAAIPLKNELTDAGPANQSFQVRNGIHLRRERPGLQVLGIGSERVANNIDDLLVQQEI